MLARAAVVVGTLSSNTGRIVQMIRTAPEDTFVTVDAPGEKGVPSAGWPCPMASHAGC